MTDLDARRRRARWRAGHRGTKELDWLLGRYAEARVGTMNEADLTRFEELLAMPEPELQDWLVMGALPADPGLAALVGEIRRLHGV